MLAFIEYFWEIVSNGQTAPVFSHTQRPTVKVLQYIAFCEIWAIISYNIDENETLFLTGNNFGYLQCKEYKFGQNMGFNWVPLNSGRNSKIPVPIPGNTRVWFQFPKAGNGLSYFRSQMEKWKKIGVGTFTKKKLPRDYN